MKHSFSFRFLVLCVAFVSPSLFAKGTSNFGLGIEPIVGYERSQQLFPTPHTKDRLAYGARATLGLLLFSVEAEYLRATSSETFTNPDASSTDQSDIAKLGLRSVISIAPISFVLRAGGQAKQTKYSHTIGGVTTDGTDAWVYKPYAGAGVRVRLSPKIALVADVVAVIIDVKNMNSNEYQATAGFSVRIP